jgi:hypothetical protein
MTPHPFRRRFYRPAEVVIGYDETVVDAKTVAMARDRWTGGPAVRTMPFRRAQADATAPLLVTFGSAEGDRPPSAPPREACAMLARALREARAHPLRVMVRLDYRGVIVRGDVRAPNEVTLISALQQVPALASVAREAVDGALPDGTHLITAAFSSPTGRWGLERAHGFAGTVWRKRFNPRTGWEAD